jgi:outer membrane protein
MKKIISFVCAVLLFGFASAGFAEGRVGVLDLYKVLSTAPQIKSMQDDLKKQFEPRGKEIGDASKILRDDIEKYNKTNTSLKSDTLKVEQQRIIGEGKKLRDSRIKFQQDLIDAQNKAMQPILKQIESVVNRIAAEQDFDVVIAKISTAYNKPKYEITDRVIDEMQKSYKKK